MKSVVFIVFVTVTGIFQQEVFCSFSFNVDIETCSPPGLRINLPHTSGIQMVAFHAKVNEMISMVQPGDIAVNLQKNGNHWTYQDHNFQLTSGDKIYYWFFVQMNHLGYTVGPKIYEVKDCHNNKQTQQPTTEKSNSEEVGQCDINLANYTLKIQTLQEEIESIQDTNSILRNLLSKHSETCTTLTLDGPLPSDDDLLMMIQAIIKEKLKLSIKVQSVVRRNDKADFQVATLDDKIAIIKASGEKLNQSRFSIMY